ncbi:Uncharacterized protein APZ42_019115 [Daphnia magna]|uniref:Uncharacterized protein n=1 Tax=Daphnia magna TaxID=35525 RepID=A0A162CFT7_9CRUS|nr:Uncharacterized protein APZ42_019115 [Daphnia magna]
MLKNAAISSNHNIYRSYNLKMKLNTFPMAPVMKIVVRSNELMGDKILKEHLRGIVSFSPH